MKIKTILKAVAAATALLVTGTAFAKDSKTLDVYWVDVEGGGGTLIVTPAGESILIVLSSRRSFEYIVPSQPPKVSIVWSKVTHTPWANLLGAVPPTRGCSHLITGDTLVPTTTVVKGEPAMGSPSRLTETSYLPRLASVCVIVYDPSPLSWHAAGTCGATAHGTLEARTV